MKKQRYFRLFSCLATIAVLLVFTALGVVAQQKQTTPELSVAGIKLGNRNSAKEFLIRYLPTTGEDGRATYYFYNKSGTQVMKVVVASFEDPFYVTEIEVFGVGMSYKKPHFVAEKIGFFETEDKIFIGFQQSLVSMLTMPGVSRGDMIGPKDVIKKKGEPTERVKMEDDREAVTYSLDKIVIPDENAENRQYRYTARYEFRKSKLRRFKLAISPLDEKKL